MASHSTSTAAVGCIMRCAIPNPYPGMHWTLILPHDIDWAHNTQPQIPQYIPLNPINTKLTPPLAHLLLAGVVRRGCLVGAGLTVIVVSAAAAAAAAEVADSGPQEVDL